MPDIIASERDRAAKLMAIAKQADRLGVTFDVERAIRTNVSVRSARRAVMMAAADADCTEISPFAAPRHRDEGSKAASTSAASLAWKKALAR